MTNAVIFFLLGNKGIKFVLCQKVQTGINKAKQYQNKPMKAEECYLILVRSDGKTQCQGFRTT